jgi:hypothetical protein
VDQYRYFLKSDDVWRETTRAGWIRAERGAGFQPKMASDNPLYMDTLATGGFSNGNVTGWTVNMAYYKPENFAWDPTFPVLS